MLTALRVHDGMSNSSYTTCLNQMSGDNFSRRRRPVWNKITAKNRNRRPQKTVWKNKQRYGRDSSDSGWNMIHSVSNAISPNTRCGQKNADIWALYFCVIVEHFIPKSQGFNLLLQRPPRFSERIFFPVRFSKAGCRSLTAFRQRSVCEDEASTRPQRCKRAVQLRDHT